MENNNKDKEAILAGISDTIKLSARLMNEENVAHIYIKQYLELTTEQLYAILCDDETR